MSSSSSTFCPLPFSKLKINSDGTMSPCCFTGSLLRDDHGNALHVDTTDLLSAWHGGDMARLRDDVTSGRVSEHCNGCISAERLGIRSARQDMLRDWEEGRQAFDHIAEDHAVASERPRFLYVKYGNTCNLKCAVCGPHSSTRWIEEHNSHGADFTEEHLGYLAGQGVRLDRSRLNRWLDGDGNIDSQIRGMLPWLCELTVSGGEPMLTGELMNLMRHCVDSGHAGHIRLKLLTNGTVGMAEFTSEILSRFAEVYLWYSIDGTGAQFEYQRYPASWEAVRGNAIAGLDAWQAAGVRGRVGINCTVSSLNLLYLPSYEAEWHGMGFRSANINVATSGRYEHRDLPPRARARVRDRLVQHDVGRLGLYDAIQWASLLDGLTVGSGVDDASRMVDGIRHMDAARGLSYADAFPEMASLVGLI